MLRTVEATIDERGVVHLKEQVRVRSGTRALVTILDDNENVDDVTAASEPALAEDWSRPEEDQAWSHLQREP
jgi:hypothetical protein